MPSDWKTIQFSMLSLDRTEKLKLIGQLWHQLFFNGGSTFSISMGEYRHEHHFKAFLIEGKEMFYVNDPMISSSLLLTKEEFLDVIVTSPAFQIERQDSDSFEETTSSLKSISSDDEDEFSEI
jgi:hypothetical protein